MIGKLLFFHIFLLVSNNNLFTTAIKHQNNASLLVQGQAVLHQMSEELSNDGWNEKSKETLELFQSLLLIECQMSNFDKETGKGMDVIKEQIVKFCDQSNSSNQIDLEKLIKNLAVSFKKDIPKMIEEMRRAETTVTVSVDGVVYGTLAEILPQANPRLAKLQSYVEAINMLRLLNQKLKSKPTKNVVGKVLNKNAMDIMPSELVELATELWTNILQFVDESVPFEVSIPQRRRRRTYILNSLGQLRNSPIALIAGAIAFYYGLYGRFRHADHERQEIIAQNIERFSYLLHVMRMTAVPPANDNARGTHEADNRSWGTFHNCEPEMQNPAPSMRHSRRSASVRRSEESDRNPSVYYNSSQGENSTPNRNPEKCKTPKRGSKKSVRPESSNSSSPGFNRYKQGMRKFTKQQRECTDGEEDTIPEIDNTPEEHGKNRVNENYEKIQKISSLSESSSNSSSSNTSTSKMDKRRDSSSRATDKQQGRSVRKMRIMPKNDTMPILKGKNVVSETDNLSEEEDEHRATDKQQGISVRKMGTMPKTDNMPALKDKVVSETDSSS
uniref:Uncharacterized protein n=1 Tax=Globodera rostochiensis TaxID=31243 RepID=A0A914H6P6_GLORO